MVHKGWSDAEVDACEAEENILLVIIAKLIYGFLFSFHHLYHILWRKSERIAIQAVESH